MQDQITHLKEQLEKAIVHIKKELSQLRTGKATVQMLDPVRVEAYGSSMSLQEVARVTTPDPTLLVVTPYDPSILQNIEKAIASSGLNLQPVIDKDLIRISVPPLTQERRQEMVKLLHQKIEQGRVMVRTIRTDTKKDIENQKGVEGVSEDDIKASVDELEKVVKQYMEQLDVVSSEKEKELLTV